MQKNDNVPVQAAMRRRLDHLSTFETLTSTNQPGYAEWADIRLDRWLVDWALRNGKEVSARSLAVARDIEVRRHSDSIEPRVSHPASVVEPRRH